MLLYSIYALIDPRNGRLFYVGITTHPQQRLLEHLSNTVQAVTPLKSNYFEELKLAKVKPILCILDEIEAREPLYAFMIERAWIWIMDLRFGTLINTNISPYIETENEAIWQIQEAKELNAKLINNPTRKILLSY